MEVTGRPLLTARESRPGPALPVPPALAGTLPGRERLAYANAFMTCFVTETIGGLARHPGPRWHGALPGGRGGGSDGVAQDLPAWPAVAPRRSRPLNPRTQPG